MKLVKILIPMLVSFIILSSSISVAEPNIPKNIDESREIIKEYVDLNDGENVTTYGFTTFGPKALSISKITVENGSFFNKSMLGLNLLLTIMMRFGMLMTPLIRPTILFVFDTDKVDFTVEYKRDVPLGFFSRQFYFTFIDEMGNESNPDNATEIWNEKHTVRVEGFYGVFMTTKRSVLMAPSFMIIGICDNVTLIQ